MAPQPRLTNAALDRALAPLTPTRLGGALWACLALALAGGILQLILAAPSPDWGNDFVAFWSAARMIVEGRPLEMFDAAAFERLQLQVGGADGEVLLWHYPPLWPALLTPLGFLADNTALLLFTVIGLISWIAAIRALFPALSFARLGLICLGGATWVTLGQGQNGLFTGAAFAMGTLGLLDNKRATAAIGAGLLMAVKPHLGLVLPLAMLARRDWPTLGATILVTALSSLAALTIVSPGYMTALLSGSDRLSAPLGGDALLTQLTSLYGALRLWGVPLTPALTIATVQALAVLAAVAYVFTRPFDRATRGASLALAAPMISPYLFHYDLTPMLLAFGFLALRGAPMAILGLLWFAPLFHRPLADLTGIPLVPIVLLAALVLTLRRKAL